MSTSQNHPDEAAKAAATAALRHYLHTPAAELELSDARAAFAALGTGAADPGVIGAVLGYLNGRGITATDIAGAAQAFLELAREFPRPDGDVLDCVGTGGDGSNTINISTAAALAAAADGLTVVKHGNRSISSRSGSGDVLEALGVPLAPLPAEASQAAIDHGFTFLFAPEYHPAFRFVGPIRAALGIPTIFNVLGPLLNPARPNLQLMGVANPQLGADLAAALQALGRERALVVHGAGTDEIATWGPTLVWELRDGEITHYQLTPAELGLPQAELGDLVGGDGAENAAALLEVFRGAGQPAHRDAVAANLAGLYYLAGRAESIPAGVELALDTLASGKVASWLGCIQSAHTIETPAGK